MLTAEQAAAHEGKQILSIPEFCRRFADLGYLVDRSMDCRALARYMTGPLAGQSYPCCSTGLREADTGLSAWNAGARRDENYRRMQALRGKICAISRDSVLEV